MKKFSETRKAILKNPKEAAEYLNSVLEEGDPSLFLAALKNVAEVHGGMSKVAELADLNRGNLYRIFSEDGNPRIMNLEKVLEALGLTLRIDVRSRHAMRKAA